MRWVGVVGAARPRLRDGHKLAQASWGLALSLGPPADRPLRFGGRGPAATPQLRAHPAGARRSWEPTLRRTCSGDDPGAPFAFEDSMIH